MISCRPPNRSALPERKSDIAYVISSAKPLFLLFTNK